MNMQTIHLPDSEAQRIPRDSSLLMACVPNSSEDLGCTVDSLMTALRSRRADVALLEVDARITGTRAAPHRIEDVDHAAKYLGDGGALLSVSARQIGGPHPALPALAVQSRASIAPIRLGPIRADTTRELHVATPVSHRSFSRFEAAEDRLELLRWHGRALAARSRPDSSPPIGSPGEPIAEADEPDVLETEIATLPRYQRLLGSGDYEVWWARASRIPRVLREIGRLREVTFRAAGEGTGRSLDLDVYDSTYTHLFVWNRACREITGAYRLGATDEIIDTEQGPYTRSLFCFDECFFERLGPALELGRSFVRPEKQRSSRTLLMLWKGIGAFVASRPRYRRLFGPVSVSADYQRFSRDLIVSVFDAECYRHPLANLVQARTPVPARTFGDGGLGDPARLLSAPSDLSAVISNAETDGKGLPVLLNEYIKLGGRFLDFNVDHDFAKVMDGLVVVDLAKTNQRLLRFYMGSEPADRFLASGAT